MIKKNKKNIISAKKLRVKAKQLAVMAQKNKSEVVLKEKESTKPKEAVTAKKLLVKAKKLSTLTKKNEDTSKEKEDVSRKQVLVAKEKEADVRRKLAITAKELAEAAKKKEVVRRKLEISAKELAATAKEKENTRIATFNLLEDLTTEKAASELASVKLESILLSIGDGLIFTDEKGSISLINKPAEKMLGWKNEEAMGKVFFEIVDIEDDKEKPISQDKRPIKMALTSGTTTATTAITTGGTYYYLRKDKTKFPVSITVTPVVLSGKVIGAIEVFRDITREKQIDKAKTEFVSLASHQLRTPLTAIGWYTEMILNGDVGKISPEQKKYLEEVYRGNKRMVELVNTLLDVSRIEMGTFAADRKLIDVIEIVRSVLDEQKKEIEKKNHIVNENFSKNIPKFIADAKLFRIVFQNLLANAIKYTPPRGKIGFKISFDDKKNILTEVSDTGCGIPLNQQDKIFTRFFRADNVTNIDTSGTGLGLYIVKSVVLNSGGKIWFETIENKGTTFYVSLPLDGLKEEKGDK